MSRLPAFTLFEVLISMLLVALLGALAVFTLGGPLRNLTDADGIAQQQLAVLLSAQRAQQDLEDATTITAAAGGAVVLEGERSHVRYEQHGDTLVRIGMYGTSAQLMLRSMATQEVTGAPGLVATWSWQIGDPAEAGPLVFRKEYDARTVFRYLIDHGHPDPYRP